MCKSSFRRIRLVINLSCSAWSSMLMACLSVMITGEKDVALRPTVFFIVFLKITFRHHMPAPPRSSSKQLLRCGWLDFEKDARNNRVNEKAVRRIILISYHRTLRVFLWGKVGQHTSKITDRLSQDIFHTLVVIWRE